MNNLDNRKNNNKKPGLIDARFFYTTFGKFLRISLKQHVFIVMEGRMRFTFFKKFSVFLILSMVLVGLMFTGLGRVQASGPYPNGVFDAGEEIYDDLFLDGSNVRLAGTVHGMVFAFGEIITIEKTAVVDDDAFLFGNQIIVEEGAVLKGNLVIGGQNAQVLTTVERSLFVGAATLELKDQAKVNHNLMFGGFHLETSTGSIVGRNVYAGNYQSILNGHVEQNVRIGAAAVRLNGSVGGNVELDVDSSVESDNGMQYWYTYLQQASIPEPIESGLVMGDSAKIDGQLIYTSPSVVFGLENSNVEGGIIYQTPQPENIVEAERQQINITYRNPLLKRLGNILRSFISLILIGGLMVWLLPKLLKETAAKAAAKPVNSAGVGLVSMIVVYIGGGMLFGLLVFLSIFFGLLSLGELGRAVFFFGFTSLAWCVSTFTILMVFISKLVVAYWLGSLILSKTMASSQYKTAITLFIGIIIVVLVSAIPFVGWLVSLAVTLIGLGAMWFYYKERKAHLAVVETE
jgi:carbonic anhydrase/acetyltransferase-like protein (isoleucine patch superfamily)